ncbi:MAG: MBL fold metallo-hydrolase [Eubacteriales bacterium]|nr:MBL fold metallo-hydrolase [Eubacteriales bacterium]
MRLCSIASGSSGNCIYVGSDNAHVLVDAGISGKRITQGLNSLDLTGEDIDGILVTHEHSDHIQGLGVIARKYHIPIYATGGTVDAMSRMKSLGKMPDGIFREIREDEPFVIKDMTINPFTISHDAVQPVGYRLECGEQSVGIATDLGKYNDYIIGHLQNLDALLLEANHDIRMLQVGKYPYYLKQRILGDRGHLSNENAGRLLCRLLHDNLKAVFLGHLSRENNYEELAYETVCSEVTLGDNPYKSRDFRIQVAKRDCISDVITV